MSRPQRAAMKPPTPTVVFDSYWTFATRRQDGTTPKRVHTGVGSVDLDVPRDRNGDFEPRIVPKGRTRFDEFDDKIVALYARGMTVRDIQAHLAEMYGVDVSHDLVSRAADGVWDEVEAWRSRPLDAVHPIIFQPNPHRANPPQRQAPPARPRSARPPPRGRQQESASCTWPPTASAMRQRSTGGRPPRPCERFARRSPSRPPKPASRASPTTGKPPTQP